MGNIKRFLIGGAIGGALAYLIQRKKYSYATEKYYNQEDYKKLVEVATKFRNSEEEDLEWENDKQCFRRMCQNITKNLVGYLKNNGYPSAIRVGGYYTDASDDYEPDTTDWDEYDLEESEDNYEWKHWWVEVDGKWIVDVTEDQFHPGEEDEYRVNVVPIDDASYTQTLSKKYATDSLPDYKPYASKKEGKLARETQDRRVKYWETALPEILKTAHGHRIALVNYSKSSDRTMLVRNLKKTKEPITVSTNEINDFMQRKGKFLKAGTTAFNRGLVTIYVVFNNTGKNLRYINVDFDIADLSEKKVRPYVLSAYEYLKNEGFEPFIVFTGSSWHLWAKKPDNGIIADYGGIKGGKYKGEPTGVVAILNEMSKAIGVPMRSASAHIPGKITIDYSTNAANRPIRVPLSLHQKTGLASIPVPANELLKFNTKQAHPDAVLKNLKHYTDMIKNYFTF